MFVSLALAFLAASATPAEAAAPVPATPAPAAKPRKICRSEAVIGSIAPKRVCTIVAPRNTVTGQNNPQSPGAEQQRPTQEGAGSGN